MKNAYVLNNAEQQLKTQSQVACFTSGTSMRPMLKAHRDIVIIEHLSGKPKLNDVLLYKYKNDDKLILHRIIKALPDGTYITRGDNTYIDEHITNENIIGVLKYFYRNGRYIDCSLSKGYRLYVLIMKSLYPIRWFLHTKLLPLAIKLKKNMSKK